MNNTPNNNGKRGLSKRGKLFLANGIALLVCIAAVFYMWFALGNPPTVTIPNYLVLMCAFTFFSLIVYYLSIIADALDGRSKKDGKNGETSPADAGHTK